MNRPPADRTVDLHRESLYQLVWSEPMVRLARRYRISDVGLAKICRTMDIPVPPPGYWRRKETGWNPAYPPLPTLRPDIPETVELTLRPAPPSRSPEVIAQEAFEQEPKNRIRLSRKLSSPHPLVSDTAAVLRDARPGLYGALSRWRERCLDVRIGPRSVERVLRILDALIKTLDASGFRVSLSHGDRPETHVTIIGHRLQFTLKEKIGRTDHVPRKGDGSYPPRWDYVPSGQLAFRLHERRSGNARKSWSDGKRARIEGKLNDIVRGLVVIADAKRACLLAQEREALARRAQQRLQGYPGGRRHVTTANEPRPQLT